MTLVIDPEFVGLIPPLSTEEEEQLTENLRAEGCRDPLVVWHTHGQQILLDGHHRYEICQAEQIPFRVVGAVGVATREEARTWIIHNQLGRRNLTGEQAAYLRGKRYNLEKKAPTGFADRAVSGPQNEGREKTAEKLAHEYNLSRATIEREGQFAEAIDTLAEVAGQEVRQDILSGAAGLTKQAVITLGQRAKDDPAGARAAVLEPELLRDERKPRYSLKGRKRAFLQLFILAQELKAIDVPPTVDAVRQWGQLLETLTIEAQRVEVIEDRAED